MSYSLMAQFSKCFSMSLSWHLILLNGMKTRSDTELPVSWKCLATALFILLLRISPLCSASLSLGWRVELPRYCFVGALELQRRYRYPPVVLQLIEPSMMISLPVLNNVTVFTTWLGWAVMKGQAAQPFLLRPLLHLVSPFLAPSAVALVLTRRIGGSLALQSNF